MRHSIPRLPPCGWRTTTEPEGLHKIATPPVSSIELHQRPLSFPAGGTRCCFRSSTSSCAVCSGQWLLQLVATSNEKSNCSSFDISSRCSLGARRPPFRRQERMLLAAASRILPHSRWRAFVVTPRTLLRWHRELVCRKWTYRHRRSGRQGLDPETVELITRGRGTSATRGDGTLPSTGLATFPNTRAPRRYVSKALIMTSNARTPPSSTTLWMVATQASGSIVDVSTWQSYVRSA
jgi:hypothetical protein